MVDGSTASRTVEIHEYSPPLTPPSASQSMVNDGSRGASLRPARPVVQAHPPFGSGTPPPRCGRGLADGAARICAPLGRFVVGLTGPGWCGLGFSRDARLRVLLPLEYELARSTSHERRDGSRPVGHDADLLYQVLRGHLEQSPSRHMGQHGVQVRTNGHAVRTRLEAQLDAQLSELVTGSLSLPYTSCTGCG